MHALDGDLVPILIEVQQLQRTLTAHEAACAVYETLHNGRPLPLPRLREPRHLRT